MWEMFSSSFQLFLRGKLFREPRQVLLQWLIGVVMAFIAVLLLAMLGAPTWLAVLAAALGTGAMQPWLFKNLKYA